MQVGQHPPGPGAPAPTRPGSPQRLRQGLLVQTALRAKHAAGHAERQQCALNQRRPWRVRQRQAAPRVVTRAVQFAQHGQRQHQGPVRCLRDAGQAHLQTGRAGRDHRAQQQDDPAQADRTEDIQRPWARSKTSLRRPEAPELDACAAASSGVGRALARGHRNHQHAPIAILWRTSQPIRRSANTRCSSSQKLAAARAPAALSAQRRGALTGLSVTDDKRSAARRAGLARPPAGPAVDREPG